VCFSNYGTSFLKAAVVISVVFCTDAMLLTLNCYGPTVQHGSRCRCKAMAVRGLREAPPFGDPTKAWVSEFLPNVVHRRLENVVGTIARLRGLDDPRFAFRRVWKIFLCLKTSRPALGPTQPTSQRLPGVLSPGIKRLGLAADHSPPSSAEVKSEW
jgi:hypothetical protein